MRHDKVNDCFKKGVDHETYEMSMDVWDEQYCGDVGYNPGSQMVQIAGISLLNDLDHYIKEKLHAKYYIRYMDDLWILCNDEEKLSIWFEEIQNELTQLGFELNKKKSKIKELSEGFLFLGFYYRMTESGKIIMTLNSENVKYERRKLRRMENKARRGEMEESKIDECFKSWKNNADNGNSYNLIRRTEQYLDDLRKGDTENGNQANFGDTSRTGRR